jgi:hypothetical protein
MSHAKVSVVIAAVASVLGFAPALRVSGWGSAWGHATGHESRTAAHCQRLPTPERNACIQCVTRPLKHHYHPDYPAGARCRPDNGKP